MYMFSWTPSLTPLLPGSPFHRVAVVLVRSKSPPTALRRPPPDGAASRWYAPTRQVWRALFLSLEPSQTSARATPCRGDHRLWNARGSLVSTKLLHAGSHLSTRAPPVIRCGSNRLDDAIWFFDLAIGLRMEPANTKFYQLGNGGSLIFERDLDALSEFLGRPHPEFHGVEVNDQSGGELQWVITADLRGKMEPPTSERILFSFRESNWLDGLARALQEALARLCGQNVAAIQGERFAHLARRNSAGEPMDLQSHPQLRHHVEHLDFMLYETQKELDNSRGYANQTHLALAQHADAIKMLAKDRKTLRQQRAKKDATIVRLRAKIASLEATVKAQEDQLNEMEEDGEDIQGGEAFLSDDDDFEEDEYTDVEDYEFLEAGEDDFIPIDVDDE
ncbi:hypothetical protein QYE76_000931 [Lolium multiflorum]|uniref:Uncharacterized protein n=1 Tax=Lolium multiflorum TaxID=4521 RepID=A0AAD8RII4_LOLMU|nr:hypothetical protein QYE76_000931 [Lolium multiflorum]